MLWSGGEGKSHITMTTVQIIVLTKFRVKCIEGQKMWPNMTCVVLNNLWYLLGVTKRNKTKTKTRFWYL